MVWKLVAAGIVTILVCTAATYVYLTKPVRATHPALTGSTMPPIIPVRDFYANVNARWGYAPSFDGSLVAWYAVDWTKTVIRVRQSGQAKPLATIKGARFDHFLWHPHKNVLLVLVEGRLWQIDPQRPSRREWTDVTPRGFQNWRIDKLSNEPDDPFVIASNDRNPAFFDLFTVRQDGGGKELLAQNEGSTIGWLLDVRATPLVRIDRKPDDGTAVFIRAGDGAPWRKLLETDARDTFRILNAPEQGGPIYALSDRGRDRIALVTVDEQSGVETVVAEHPRVDVKEAVRLSPNDTKPDFVIFEDGYPEIRALTSTGQEVESLMFDGTNPVDVELLGRSPDGRFVTVARSWRQQSYEYFLYDLQDGTATKLGEAAFRRHKDILTETKPVSFKARDGLEIPAFLILPRGIEPKKLPTIVVIHGGPAQQDSWGYNHDYQFLANRGYAVLSVNFRGSTGYGKAFRRAGYGEIGKAMQDDIVDAANWLVAEGIADPANMAVLGASYGGYSAALAMTRDPGLFKAAIVEHAATDLVYLMRNTPHAWGLHLDEMERYFGDPDNDADIAEMRERSPLTHADKVKGAILFMAGKEDRIVGFEQSEEFERTLKAAGKDVMAVFFGKEGHGFARWQTKVKRARLMEDFLAEHLGGRAGGFDYVELAAKYLN